MTAETDRIAELEAQLAQSIPKAEVVRVSRRYAQQHGWCNVVDQALREVGALAAPMVVNTALAVTQNVQLTVPSDVWNGLDEDGQKEYIASLARRAGLFITGSYQDEDLRLNMTGRATNFEVGVPGEAAADGTPAGYVWRYRDNEGRVMHLWDARLDQANNEQGDSVCGRLHKPRRRTLLMDSTRATGGHCGRCEERAARLLVQV